MLGGMNRIKLHQTSPEFSALAFGTWRLLDDPLTATPGALLELLKVCLDCGITTIDTAEIYGGYRVEELVGAALALDPGVKARMERREQMAASTGESGVSSVCCMGRFCQPSQASPCPASDTGLRSPNESI